MEETQIPPKHHTALPALPVEVKLEILRHATYDDAHDPGKLSHLCNTRLAELAESPPFKNGTPFVPSVTDLIRVHFSVEYEAFPKEYCVKALTTSYFRNRPECDVMAQELWPEKIQFKKERTLPFLAGWKTREPPARKWIGFYHCEIENTRSLGKLLEGSISDNFRHLFYLALVSRRVHKILDVIHNDTDQEFGLSEYKAMLRLCRFVGPNERIPLDEGPLGRPWVNDYS